MRIKLALAAALSAGTLVAVAEAKPRVETIRYETGPCFGFCPAYRVTVTAAGEGLFEGSRFTAVQGKRRFRVSASQFAAFRDRLRADRPDGARALEGGACASLATDQISVDVEWSGGRAPSSHLHAYFGCDMDRNRALFERLRSAPKVLPIAGFIGDGRRPR